MKAALNRRYGSPDVIEIQDVAKPAPKDDQVLIKVHAASVNPLDHTFLRGTPYLVRLMGGLTRPKDPRLGMDVAGHVEATGRNVTRFRPGDEVFGMCRGSFAEYVCASESDVGMSALALKPGNLTFEQAAAVPVAAFTALQALRDHGQIKPGAKVLINGASGGVGTFAVHMAKNFGAEVTGVCSSGNADMVRSLGADRVIDYTQHDVTKAGLRYDLFLDCVGNHSFAVCRSLLNPNGTLLVVGGKQGRWIGPVDRLLTALMLSKFVKDRLVAFIAKAKAEDLNTIREMIETGKITPMIGKCYRLAEVPEALRQRETGHARGKLVVTLG